MEINEVIAKVLQVHDEDTVSAADGLRAATESLTDSISAIGACLPPIQGRSYEKDLQEAFSMMVTAKLRVEEALRAVSAGRVKMKEAHDAMQ